MRSVFYRGTGKIFIHGQKLEKFDIVRNNEIFTPDFLGDTRGTSIFQKGDRLNGIDARLNATGDTADNATGYQIAIDTLTYLVKQVSEQKFYEVPFADFMPVIVGEGAFSESLLFNRTYSTAEDFEAGNIRQGNAGARLSSADAAVDGVTQKTQFWAKDITYSLIEVEQALRANSWDPIQGMHEARKTNWDLGLQITAFLGLSTDSRYPGLLTNSAFTADTGTITKYISSMTAAEFATFLAAFLQTYITNVGSTAMPDTMIMPQADYVACSQLMVQNVIAAGSGTYVGMNLLEYLKTCLKTATGNQNFEIKSLYYADKVVNNALRGLNKNYYMLYRRDPKSIRMNIPVDYTVTQANSINNFQFQDVAYGQYTGLVSLRNKEAMVYTF
jgi:hypothetical protein